MEKSMPNDESVTGEITQLLAGFEKNDAAATEQLTTLVYGHLRKMAASLLKKERPDISLQPTTLVNEAFDRLLSGKRPSPKDRIHFFSIAALVMRRVLVDHARSRNAGKRGGELQIIALDEAIEYSNEKSDQLIALDDALKTLEKMSKRQARIVELRFFAGMTAQETAAAMGISADTVHSDWSLAKAWLLHELQS